MKLSFARVKAILNHATTLITASRHVQLLPVAKKTAQQILALVTGKSISSVPNEDEDDEEEEAAEEEEEEDEEYQQQQQQHEKKTENKKRNNDNNPDDESVPQVRLIFSFSNSTV